MTSRRWQDDEGVLADLREAARLPGATLEAVRRAGREAFARRSKGLALAGLSYDSVLDDAVQLRSRPLTRILTFRVGETCVEIELDDEKIVGQFIPPAPGEVAMATLDGIAATTTADPMGCFALPRPDPGLVRFQCRTAESTFLTDWVRL